MSQLSIDSVVNLVLGLVIGLPQLLLAILTWCEARRSASQVKDPEKNALDGILLLLCHEPTATQLNLVPLASNGRVFTLDQLDIDHKVSSQANTIKQFVKHDGNGCRSPQPVRPASCFPTIR
ncbi:hypothetical protein V8E51_015777 [Hyaloscypha variabilis]